MRTAVMAIVGSALLLGVGSLSGCAHGGNWAEMNSRIDNLETRVNAANEKAEEAKKTAAAAERKADEAARSAREAQRRADAMFKKGISK